jgi:hypothetical protein
MTASAYNKLASDLTPKILAAFDGLKDGEMLTSKEISERAITAAGLDDKLTDAEKIDLANLYSKRVASLARPGVDKLYRDPNREGRQFSYRLFRDGDVNSNEGKKDTAAAPAKPSAASTNGNRPTRRVVSAINDLDSGVVNKIAKMGVDELQAVIQVSMTRMTELVTETASELDNTRSRLEKITAAVTA